MSKLFKILIASTVVLLVLLSVPALVQNDKREKEITRKYTLILDEAAQLCSKGCPISSRDVIPGTEKEAKAYCINQCSDNMRLIRKDILQSLNSELYSSRYNYIFGSIYCTLGLKCSALNIQEFVNNY